jgi:hypothetical protein
MAILNIKSIVILAISLTMLYLLTATLIMPYFRDTYENYGPQLLQRGGTGLINNYCNTPTNTVVACASCNSATGLSTFLSTCYSLISAGNNTHCYQCTDFGFKTVSTGLLLFIFVIAMISFAVAFLKYVKR